MQTKNFKVTLSGEKALLMEMMMTELQLKAKGSAQRQNDEFMSIMLDVTESAMDNARRHLGVRFVNAEQVAAFMEHMNLTDPEMRAGVELQRKEIDRLRQQLRDEGNRVAELSYALQSLTDVATRDLPDYNEHPAIQKADSVLKGSPMENRT